MMCFMFNLCIFSLFFSFSKIAFLQVGFSSKRTNTIDNVDYVKLVQQFVIRARLDPDKIGESIRRAHTYIKIESRDGW